MANKLINQANRENNQVDYFVQNPATELLVMKSYDKLSSCGWRQYMLTKINDDLRKLTDNGSNMNGLNKESVNSIVTKFLNDFPEDICQELMNDIITHCEQKCSQ